MTEATFQIISNVFCGYKIILRIALFLWIWKIFYPTKIIDSLKIIWKKKEYLQVIFMNILFWNFHSLCYLIANSAYQFFVTEHCKGYTVETRLDMELVYETLFYGMCIMFFIYTLAFILMIFGVKRLHLTLLGMKWNEFLFSSILNVIGFMFTQMIVKIMIVQIDTEVFLLYDEKTELLWWIPVIAILLYFSEMIVLFSHQKYLEKQRERELLFIENQQIHILKQRLIDVETFYGNIQKVRHEMRNHMMNIKGLVTNEHYDEVEKYIQALDESIQILEYKYATGNPVTDVLINDKYRQMKEIGIRFKLDFKYRGRILIYDIAIVLNNLLDNAIEACKKIPREDRYITLSLNHKNHFVLITVENAFDGIVKWGTETKLPETTKLSKDDLLEHGLGLKNVKDVANRYYGDLDIRINEHTWKATVLLQEKEE